MVTIFKVMMKSYMLKNILTFNMKQCEAIAKLDNVGPIAFKLMEVKTVFCCDISCEPFEVPSWVSND